MVAWSPLRGGWLSGKYRRNMSAPPDDSRVKAAEERGGDEIWANYANEHTWSLLDCLLAVAQESAKTPAQVALNWLMQRAGVTAPIVGARSIEQLEDNLGSTGWSLSREQVARLDQASEIPLPYPYYFINRYQTGRWR